MGEIVRLVRPSRTDFYRDPKDIRVYDNGVLVITEEDGKTRHTFNRQGWVEVHAEETD